VPAQLLIRHLRSPTGKPCGFDAYLYDGILEHILAPVLPLNSTRRCVKASLIINKAEFHGPSSAGLAPDGG
jgi:hypothetical protein